MIPSSVPIASSPALSGDSSMLVTLLNSAVPSLRPSAVESGTAPRIGSVLRSMARVRSGLIFVQLSPRSLLLKRKFAAIYTPFTKCFDGRIGAFQLKRSGLSPGLIVGRMLRLWPVRVS